MSSDFNRKLQSVLTRLGVSSQQLIGKGKEGHVFRYGDDKVLKIYPQTNSEYLDKLKNLQQRVAQAKLPYKTPLIETIDQTEDVYYTVERRLDGQDLETVFSDLTFDQQSVALRNFIAALKSLRNIDVSDLSFGQILDLPNSLRSVTWKEFLLNKLRQKLMLSKDRISRDVVQYSLKVKTLEHIIEEKFQVEPQKTFVHGDYYPINVLVNKKLEITALLDLGVHTSVGDYRLDVANINLLQLSDKFSDEHLRIAHELAIREYGEEIIPYLDLYGFYYAFYFSDLYTSDPEAYQLCLSILNDKKRWMKYL